MFTDILKCTQYDLLRAKAKLGQMYFVTDTRVLYKDNSNNIEQRMRFNAIILHTESERLNSIRPVVGKFYYVEETNSLWLFDTRWVLKIGKQTQYNTYYAGEYVSPIINVDESITGITGDKIIDNNGLLGEGSVVVRDMNRTMRALLKADTTYNTVSFKSYLDDGLLFIPNAHLPYKDLTTSLGALHLTVNKDINSTDALSLTGNAHYYGDWNNYGNMYLIQKQGNAEIYPDAIPINDLELLKFYITSTKENEDGSIMTTHFVIRPISTSSAIINIISVNDENSKSVVQNDMGELIFTSGGDLVENVTFECRRRIPEDAEYRTAEYTLDNYSATITIRQHKESVVMEALIPNIWADANSKNIIVADKWYRDKVLTSSQLDVSDSYIKRIT